METKKHLTYLVTCHGNYKRTANNIKEHKIFCDKLSGFNVNFCEANTQDLGNWGGMSGLTSLFLDQISDLPQGGYFACFEDDIILKNDAALSYAIKVLESESTSKNLAYVGHGKNFYKNNKWKSNNEFRHSMGEWSRWTDGGFYIFKNKKLLEIKNKLSVLPGVTTPDGKDLPLDRNSCIDFRPQKPRIIYHEVGFPTRLSFHGYEILGIHDHNFIGRLSESYDNV